MEWLKWTVIGLMVFAAVVVIANMDRNAGDPPEDDGPIVIDEDEVE